MIAIINIGINRIINSTIEKNKSKTLLKIKYKSLDL